MPQGGWTREMLAAWGESWHDRRRFSQARGRVRTGACRRRRSLGVGL